MHTIVYRLPFNPLYSTLGTPRAEMRREFDRPYLHVKMSRIQQDIENWHVGSFLS